MTKKKALVKQVKKIARPRPQIRRLGEIWQCHVMVRRMQNYYRIATENSLRHFFYITFTSLLKETPFEEALYNKRFAEVSEKSFSYSRKIWSSRVIILRLRSLAMSTTKKRWRQSSCKAEIFSYSYIRIKLDDLQKAGEVSEFTKSAVYAMTNHVLALIARKYQRVQEVVENVMRGKILDYEAKNIRNKAIAEERKKFITETEERAKHMLRDKMTLPLVEKYTHLPMPRIEELARGLGLL